MTFIIDAIRTPRGRGNAKGSLSTLHPVELLAQQMRAITQRNPKNGAIDSALITDAVIGCVTQTGEQGSNIGKLAALAAGWSDAVPGVTINRYCASGLSAVLFAAQQAQANESLAVGGGVEVMSRTAMGADHGPLTHDPELQRQLQLVPMGLAADAVATQEGFSRLQCDAYALASQQRAVAARASGYFKSIVPVTCAVSHAGSYAETSAVNHAEGSLLLQDDETPRESTTAASLALMPAAFASLGESGGYNTLLCQQYALSAMTHVHHAGNSPAMADGASLVLLASASAVQRHGLQPRAHIVGSATVSVDRTLALTGAVDATRLALQRSGLKVADIDLFEINESFAALMLHYLRHLDIPHDKLNVNGGAIALGHAMGSTGSALVSSALDELERRGQRHAVVAVCGAAGVAVALVISRLDTRF